MDQTEMDIELEQKEEIKNYEKKIISSRNQANANNKKPNLNLNILNNKNNSNNNNQSGARKNKQILNTDDPSHKYEIKSMEDLFLDADNFSDKELFNNLNPEGNLNLKDNEVIEDANEKEFINYDELALNSFENLNLEDFKRGTTNALNSNNNNKITSDSKSNIKNNAAYQNPSNNNINNNNNSFNLNKLKIKTDFNDFENELLEIDYADQNNMEPNNPKNNSYVIGQTEENEDLLSNENIYNCNYNNNYAEDNVNSQDSPLIDEKKNQNRNKIIIDNLFNFNPEEAQDEDILIESEDYYSNPNQAGAHNYVNYANKSYNNNNNIYEKNIYEYIDINNKIINIKKEEKFEEDESANNINDYAYKNINKANFINRMRIQTHDSMENFMENNDQNLMEDQIELEEKRLGTKNDEELTFPEKEEFYKMEPQVNNNLNNFNSKITLNENDLQYANSKNAMFNKTMNLNPPGFNRNFNLQNIEVNEYNSNKTDNNYNIDYESINKNINFNKNSNNALYNSQTDSLPVNRFKFKLLLYKKTFCKINKIQIFFKLLYNLFININQIADDFMGEDVFDENALENIEYYDGSKKSKIDFQREIKSKRPPTRYGNREDQVLWEKNRQQKNFNLHNLGISKKNQSDKNKNNKNLKNLFSDEEPEFESRIKGKGIKNKTLPKNVLSNKNNNENFKNFINKNNNSDETENAFNNNVNNANNNFFNNTNPKLNYNNNNNISNNKNIERNNNQKRLNSSKTQKNLEIKISCKNSNFSNAKNNNLHFKNQKTVEDDIRTNNRSLSSLNNNNNNENSFEEQFENDPDNEDPESANRENKYRIKTSQTVNDELNINNHISSSNNNNNSKKDIQNINNNINKNLDNNLDKNLEASDFRKTLRAQLSKNHNKIFSNLKKLYMNNELINPDSGKNINVYNKNKSKSPGNLNTQNSNNNINKNLNSNKNANLNSNKNLNGKFRNQDQEEYSEPKDDEDFQDFHSYTNRNAYEPRNEDGLNLGHLQATNRTLSSPDEIYLERDNGKYKKKASQNTNHLINTNLTESKYLGRNNFFLFRNFLF
jgi:hypothetical protein